MSLGEISQTVSLLALVVTWCILQPLKTSITDLKNVIEKLAFKFDKTEAEVNELRERVATLEACVKSLHARLDDFLKRG